MAKALNRFYASRKAAIVMVMAGIVFTVLSQLSFVPLRNDFKSVALGLLIGLNGFSRVFADEWEKHGYLHGDFLSQSFFVAWMAFILIFAFVEINRIFLKLW